MIVLALHVYTVLALINYALTHVSASQGIPEQTVRLVKKKDCAIEQTIKILSCFHVAEFKNIDLSTNNANMQKYNCSQVLVL